MKKLALLVIGMVLVFSLSSVFATEEEDVLLISPAPETEVSGEPTTVDAVDAQEAEENLSGEEVVAEDVSGEITNEDTATVIDNTDAEIVDDVEPAENAEEETATASSSNNGSIVGAIIAIVIVVAVVAIAAILRKD